MKINYQDIKQTAKNYVLPALVAGSMALGGCYKTEEYKIDNQEVEFKEARVPLRFSPSSIINEKGKLIKYKFEDKNFLELKKVRIFGEVDNYRREIYNSSDPKDHEVIEVAKDRVKYLLEKKDSCKNEVEKRLQKAEKERIEFGLKNLEGKLK